MSIGIDNFFSIEVTNWKTEEILAFRNTGNNYILDVVFNRSNIYELATSGY